MPAKMFTLKEFTEVFQDLGSTKDKMLEVITAQKGSIEKMLTPYDNLCDGRRQANVQTTLDKIFTNKQNLILSL